MCAVKNVMKFNYHSRTTSINKKKTFWKISRF